MQTAVNLTSQDFLSITRLENGNLQFSIEGISVDDLAELQDLYEQEKREAVLFGNIFEDLLHESFYFVPENNYTDIGALTDAPILSDYDWWNDEEGQQEFMNEMNGLTLWWFPDYQIRNAFEELLLHKKVEFTLIQNA